MKPSIFVISAIIALLAACGDGDPSNAEPPVAYPVKVRRLQPELRMVELEYLGIVSPKTLKNYSFKVAGRIAGVAVKTGQTIVPGQKLMELENDDYRLDYQAAELTQKQAREAFEEAREYYQKIQVAHRGGGISDSDLEKARLDFTVKEATFQQARINSQVKARRLGDTVLQADLEGYVLEVPLKRGELVDAGTPVLAVRADTKIVEVGLAQKDLGRVAPGSGVRLTVDRHQGSGKVIKIAQYPDLETLTYRVEIMPDKDLSRQIQYVGLVAEVRFQVGEERGIWIPISIISSDGQPYVYVVEDHRAVRKNIRLGRISGPQVLVEELSQGELLVIAGIQSLKEGMLVQEIVESPGGK